MAEEPFRVEYQDYEEQELHLARTPDGLEAFVPTGRPSRSKAQIVVNQGYAATIDLPVGVTRIPRSILKNASGQSLPPDERIISVGVSFPDRRYRAIAFAWSK